MLGAMGVAGYYGAVARLSRTVARLEADLPVNVAAQFFNDAATGRTLVVTGRSVWDRESGVLAFYGHLKASGFPQPREVAAYVDRKIVTGSRDSDYMVVRGLADLGRILLKQGDFCVPVVIASSPVD